MSGVKHTPGPWTPVHNSWEFSTVYGPDDEVIASCQIHHDVTEETQDDLEPVKDANARLIAAAPCMFEYILSSAQNGCATAQEIVERATGDRPEKGGTL